MAEIKISDIFLDEEVLRYSSACKNIKKDEKPSDWIKRINQDKS